MLKTRITELFGIKYPIVQGGLFWISRAPMVAAVSNAGGLGVLTSVSFSSLDEYDAEIKRIKELTDKPFGVNLTLLPTLRPVNIDGYIDVIIKNNVKIVETAGRSPEPYIERLKGAGIKVIHKCTAVRFAVSAQKIGCDVISIDGIECAGHPGEDDVTSLILTPLAASAVTIPVIASGGFGDGRGLIAALSLGADGVNMGTRFMATKEAGLHPAIEKWLIDSSERDTMLIQRSLRNTVRMLRNPTAEKVAELENHGATLEQLAPYISGVRGTKMLESGDIDDGLLSAGQVVGLIHDIPSVKELIDRIVQQAEEILSRFKAEGTFKPLK